MIKRNSIVIETCLFVCVCGRLEKDFAENQNLKNKDTALGSGGWFGNGSTVYTDFRLLHFVARW